MSPPKDIPNSPPFNIDKSQKIYFSEEGSLFGKLTYGHLVMDVSLKEIQGNLTYFCTYLGRLDEVTFFKNPSLSNTSSTFMKHLIILYQNQCLLAKDDFSQTRKVWVNSFAQRVQRSPHFSHEMGKNFFDINIASDLPNLTFEELLKLYRKNGNIAESVLGESKIKSALKNLDRVKRQFIVGAILLVGLFAVSSNLFNVDQLLGISGRGASHHTIQVLQVNF